MSIEAKVHAPTASFTARARFHLITVLLFVAGLLTANTFPISSTLLGLGAWLWLVNPLVSRRRRGRTARVECDGGKIRVLSKRHLPRTILTRSLVGASVARNGDGAVVTLSERGSSSPLAIEVPSIDAANEIRSSLGIPHGGFGEISWTVQPKPIDISLMFTRTLAALLLLLEFFVTPVSSAVGAALLVPAIVASILAAVLALTRLFIADRSLRMRSTGILATGDGDPVNLPFAEISDIVDDGKMLAFRPRQTILESLLVPSAPTRWLPSGLGAEERALMIAQLRGALAVSNGQGAPLVDPTSHLDALKRNDASVTDWLARLDALAQTHENAAYRSTAIAKEDLWRALESHDAPPDVRAGAARVLLRVSSEKEHDRIARVIDSIHTDDERNFIRAALRDDVEEAAAEIEETDLVSRG